MVDHLRSAVSGLRAETLHPLDRNWIANGEGDSPEGLADRLTGPYRYDLESLGWDVDMLLARLRAIRYAIVLTISEDPPVIHAQVHPGDTVAEKIRGVPGFRWDGNTSTWAAPLQPRTAHELRTALTGHQVRIGADVAARLTAARSHLPIEVDITGDHVTVTTPTWISLRDELQRIPTMTWSGTAWQVHATPANAAAVLKAVEPFGLHTSEAVRDLAVRTGEPFDYDHTIVGLVGVPTSEVHSIAAVPARGKVPSLEERLAAMNIETVWDLLMHIPHRYIDRNNRIHLAALGAHVGEEISILANITEMGRYDTARKMLRVTVGDGTGFLSLTFFRTPWIARQFRRGDEVLIHGKLGIYQPKGSSRPASFQMTNPMMDALGDSAATMVPVYPQSEKSKVTTWDVHRAAMESVGRLGDLVDPLPEELRSSEDLIGRKEAFVKIHRPQSLDDVTHARTRLAFDELLRMQIVLGIQRGRRRSEDGIVHNPTGVLSGAFTAALPYSLTGAQQRALGEIVADLRRPHPMNRLLQGDVGVGKSVCAALTILAAIEGGHQAALMAPTEILASQLHREMAEAFTTLTHPVTGAPVVVEFLGGKTTAKNKRRILAALADGSIDLVVGTHALLVDDVTFANLGLVVIDEQHRFGVDQRATLRAKGDGRMPDVLAMTATPIPRTAALTVFGDLEQSVLDEMPPGRTPIATSWVPSAAPLDDPAAATWQHIRDAVAAGRQAYVVASLVQDNEKIAAASAEETFQVLDDHIFTDLRVGLVHGQMPRDEREVTMAAFTAGDLDVLVSTTVIEVGVNVPNATVMVVLDAPRFGIAQLHQIRGRVGRGAHASRCILVGEAASDDGRARMEALVESTDGFYLSEVDLSLRGSGALFGTRQSGQSDLKVARLPDDLQLVQRCRTIAAGLLESDPELKRRPGLRYEVAEALGDNAADALSRV